MPLVWWLSLRGSDRRECGRSLSAHCNFGSAELRVAARLIAAGRRCTIGSDWGCMLFVLTWIFSGWLSMDDGLLFSTGKPTASDIAAIAGAPDWNSLPDDELGQVGPQTIEAEWFAFNGRIYRRERTALGVQHVAVAGSHTGAALPAREFLSSVEMDASASRLGRKCSPAFIAGSDDAYALTSVMPGAPIFRLVCGNDWFHVDASNGTLLEKLDLSRRTYRGLHRAAHPSPPRRWRFGFDDADCRARRLPPAHEDCYRLASIAGLLLFAVAAVMG